MVEKVKDDEIHAAFWKDLFDENRFLSIRIYMSISFDRIDKVWLVVFIVNFPLMQNKDIYHSFLSIIYFMIVSTDSSFTKRLAQQCQA